MTSSSLALRNELKDRGIYINSRIPILKNVLLNLELSTNLKPPWFIDNKSSLVFFPFVYKNTSDGEVLVFFNDGKNKFPAVVRKNANIIFNFDPQATIEFLQKEQYLIPKKLLYQFMPLHYHIVPGRVRRYIKKILVLIAQKTADKNKLKFPSWPVETSVETIRHIFFACKSLLGNGDLEPLSSWPENKKFAVVLSHDIDTSEGFHNIDKFIRIEKRYNMRSCWFVVGQFFNAHRNQLTALMQDGFEIGCHGYVHDNKLISLGQVRMRDSLLRCADMLNKLEIKGFRSPSLLRSAELFNVLKDLFLYDSSVPDTEAFLQIAPRSGCCTVFPYKTQGKLWELPITLPLDSTLLALGYKPDKIYGIWKDKIEWIKKIGGMVQIATHSESYYSGNSDMLRVYEKLLDFISHDSDYCWIAKPQEIVAWCERCDRSILGLQ